MKVSVINKKSIDSEKTKIINDFIRLLQEVMPLKNDIKVIFLNKHKKNTTTGSELNGEIRVLYGNRILVDVLRTLCHEWTHCYQDENIEHKKDVNIPGKPLENMSNVIAGAVVRYFTKTKPEISQSLFE
jgi:hypothetical protein